MATLTKITTEWTAFTGAPGFTNHYFQDSPTAADLNADVAAIRSLWSNVVGILPVGLTLRVRNVAQDFDNLTGDLIGERTITTPGSAIVGTTVGSYAGPAGIAISWRTSLALAGRILSGRTFIVPALGCYDADGTISTAALTTVQNAANLMLTAAAGKFVIWRQPKPGGGVSGHSSVIQANIRDRACVLRSRRD